MKFGLSSEHFQIVQDLAIAPLKSYGAQVWIFGSRARGDYRTFSDLDILYMLNTPLPRGVLAGIVEDLEESRLPIKVELVHETDLAESYRENILRDKVKI